MEGGDKPGLIIARVVDVVDKVRYGQRILATGAVGRGEAVYIVASNIIEKSLLDLVRVRFNLR